MSKRTWEVTFTEAAQPGEYARRQVLQGQVGTKGILKYDDNKKQTRIDEYIRREVLRAVYEQVTWPNKHMLQVEVRLTRAADENALLLTGKAEKISGQELLDNQEYFKKHYWSFLQIPPNKRKKVDKLDNAASGLFCGGGFGAFVSLFIAAGGAWQLVHAPALYPFLIAMAVLFVIFIVLASVSCVPRREAKVVRKQAEKNTPALPTVTVSDVSVLKSDRVVIAESASNNAKSEGNADVVTAVPV